MSSPSSVSKPPPATPASPAPAGAVGVPSSRPTHGESRNTDIEVLRATAILFTLFAHWGHGWLGALGSAATTFQRYTAFWTGVDLFFCISGFVIADSLLRQTLGPFSWASFRVWVSAFWIRRAFRLLPSAWFWILVSVVVVALYLDEDGGLLTTKTLWDAGFAFLNVINFYYIDCVPAMQCGFLGVFWSLALEEQFYLILPALLFVVRSRTALIVMLAVICCVQIATPRWNGFLPEGSALWFVRTDAIILGVLIAFWKRYRSHASAEPTLLSNSVLRVLCVVAGLAALAMVASPNFDAGWGTGLAAVCSAVLVWMASYDRGYVMRANPLLPILMWFGARSYAMYLIHMLVLRTNYEFFTRLLGKPLTQVSPTYGITMILTTAVITFVLAELNYLYLETPLRLRGRRIAARIEAGRRNAPLPGPQAERQQV